MLDSEPTMATSIIIVFCSTEMTKYLNLFVKPNFVSKRRLTVLIRKKPVLTTTPHENEHKLKGVIYKKE